MASLFLTGLLAPYHGLVFLLRRRPLWVYAAIPLIVGLFWSGLSLSAAALPAGDARWSKVLFGLLTFLLDTGILFIQVIIALLSPLFDLLAEQTEEELGVRPRGPTFWQELVSFSFLGRAVFALVEAVKLLVFKLGVYLLAALIALVPVAGLWLAYPLSGLVTGVDFLDYALARREWRLQQKIAVFKRHWPAYLGFGITLFACFEAPGLGGLILAPAAVGGTWLLTQTGAITATEGSASR